MNKAVVDYFFVELGVERHFEALRHFLLMEDGEFAQSLSDLLFEKVRLRNERCTCVRTLNDGVVFLQFLGFKCLPFFFLTHTLRFKQIRFNSIPLHSNIF